MPRTPHSLTTTLQRGLACWFFVSCCPAGPPQRHRHSPTPPKPGTPWTGWCKHLVRQPLESSAAAQSLGRVEPPHRDGQGRTKIQARHGHHPTGPPWPTGARHLGAFCRSGSRERTPERQQRWRSLIAPELDPVPLITGATHSACLGEPTLYFRGHGAAHCRPHRQRTEPA